MERTLIGSKGYLRPFSNSARVQCRGYSLPLQRVIVDFGSEIAFADAAKKIKEHYGIDLPASSIRVIVEDHGTNIMGHSTLPKSSTKKLSKNIIIAQSDGCMVPIVTTDKENRNDRRKTRQTKWKESRLSLAYEKGSLTTYYQATLGSTNDAGDQLKAVVQEVGRGKRTKIHFVGDGALWITDQTERVFGNKVTYVIDFFHLSQYLSEAALCISNEPQNWFHEQQRLMKENKADLVLQNLKEYLEDENREKHDCGAKKCYQYMEKRMHQFNYKDAIEQDLPIGSGKVESSHRTVIQKRLKLAGAWWLEENAEKMLAIRTARANNDWESYWHSRKIYADENTLTYQHF